jgi:hypothetical protein
VFHSTIAIARMERFEWGLFRSGCGSISTAPCRSGSGWRGCRVPRPACAACRVPGPAAPGPARAQSLVASAASAPHTPQLPAGPWRVALVLSQLSDLRSQISDGPLAHIAHTLCVMRCWGWGRGRCAHVLWVMGACCAACPQRLM